MGRIAELFKRTETEKKAKAFDDMGRAAQEQQTFEAGLARGAQDQFNREQIGYGLTRKDVRDAFGADVSQLPDEALYNLGQQKQIRKDADWQTAQNLIKAQRDGTLETDPGLAAQWKGYR